MDTINVQRLNTQKLNDIQLILNHINKKVDELNKVEIKITNGDSRTVTYERTEFLQMLFDRRSNFKRKARVTAKDILLFGSLTALVLRVFEVF